MLIIVIYKINVSHRHPQNLRYTILFIKLTLSELALLKLRSMILITADDVNFKNYVNQC